MGNTRIVYDNRRRKCVIINNYNQYVRDATEEEAKQSGCKWGGWAVSDYPF